MLKVMIIDDEYYFREALKVSLPWNELGFDICGEAKNGKDALEKAELLNPDIMLIDINMPIMDGLELIEKIREKGISSKCIILTGHSEFNYAKQAVQLGVNNYILKPVNEEELKLALFEVRRLVEREANIRIEVDSLRKQVRDSIPLLKEKFLNELLLGSLVLKESEVLKKMDYLGIDMKAEEYKVIAIELDYDDSMGWDDEEKQLWIFAVSNIACEILAERFRFHMCYDADDRICIIIELDEAVSSDALDPMLENRLELIRSSIYKHLGFTITIGVGTEKKELFDIPASYKEAVVALKNKLTIGNNKTIEYCSVAETGIRRTVFSGEHRSQLLMNMRTADEKEVMKLISQIFSEIRQENLHIDILLVISIEMTAVCLESLVEMGLNHRDVFPEGQGDIIEEIMSKKSIDGIEGWIIKAFQHTMDAIKRNRSSKASKLIEEVKKYIIGHYQNDELSIDEIARKLYVNYAHLCFIFKRDTGVTINEFLTEFRIKKAKELMDCGNTLVLDVASKVGYADPNYFGKCFKKYYGLAPSKYIENIRK